MNLEQAKELFFAQYLGQKCAVRIDDLFIYTITHTFLYKDVSDRFLLLRTVNQLTDDEKAIIADRMQIYPEDVLDWINGDCGQDYFENLHTWLPCYDILKAFGILLPFTYLDETGKPVTLSVDEIIALGWAKVKS